MPRIGGVVRALEDNWLWYLLFIPTLLYMVLLLWIPLVQGAWMSLHSWPTGGDPQWLGLGNYLYLFSWEPFYTSLYATLWFGASTFLQIGLAVAAACLVANLSKFKSIVSTGFIIPYTMPPVVTGTIWLFLLNPSYGTIWNFTTELGILAEPIYWAQDGTSALAVVTGVLVWTFWPFMFLIIVATRESIPNSYYETARVYGANRVQMFLSITLPQLKSAILVAVSIRLIWNLSKISQAFQLTQGGPGYDTSVLGVLLYRFAYNQGQFGRGFAVGMVLLVLTIAFVALFIREFEQARKEGTSA
ncbi:carbohydrate ABC transporter permease [Halopenitus sp. H-Gu1]|uniref:carbohydrate ABC transporter permease n=1 Tax=Halopenitus sp. H-Gu1 TaxID=3242697 RepID=UPI00359EAFCB